MQDAMLMSSTNAKSLLYLCSEKTLCNYNMRRIPGMNIAYTNAYRAHRICADKRI